MERIVISVATLALATFGLQRFTHAQTCGAGSQVSTLTVANSIGPQDPPWNNVPLAVPQFDPVTGQTLIRADITVRGGISGSVQAENLSTTGACVIHWCLGSSLHVDVPVSGVPPFMLNPSNCNTQTLLPFDGTVDYRGPSGFTQIILPFFTQSTTSITDPGVLATVFTGNGNVTFNSSADDTSSHTGCGNLASLFLNHTEVDVTIVYTYCSAGSDMCVPGQHGVMTCPCGNPQTPAGSVKGCNNSSATGGATLSSGGAAAVRRHGRVHDEQRETDRDERRAARRHARRQRNDVRPRRPLRRRNARALVHDDGGGRQHRCTRYR